MTIFTIRQRQQKNKNKNNNMKQLEFTSEKDFKTEILEFEDEHYEIANKLHEQYKSELLSKCSPIMVGQDKQSLLFCVNLGDKLKDRGAYERGDNMYRIRIEKIINNY